MATPVEQWSEPFGNIMAGESGLRSLSPCFMLAAIKQQLLSSRFISVVDGIFSIVSTGEGLDMETDIVLEDGSTENLFVLCCRFLEHSYKMACSKYDEPQLAILALHVLCHGCLVFTDNPHFVRSLLHLTSLDERTRARVLMHGTAAGLPLRGDTRRVLFYLLEDFRTLLKRKHNELAGLLVICVNLLGGVLVSETEEPCTRDAMELLYLLSEYFIASGDYSSVRNLREVYSPIWKLYKEDPSGLEMYARRVELCIARAMELTGYLKESHDLYSSCEGSTNERLEACLAGKQVYLFEKLSVRTQNLSDGSSRLSARQLPNGKIAIFFTRKEGNKSAMSFQLFDPDTNALINSELPNKGFKWRRMSVVESSSTSLLRVLVAPRKNEQERDDIHELMEDMLGGLGSRFRKEEPLTIERRQEEYRRHDTE